MDLGEAGAEQSGVGSGEEQLLAQSGVGDAVAVGCRDALDESVDAEPARGRPSGEVPLEWSCS